MDESNQRDRQEAKRIWRRLAQNELHARADSAAGQAAAFVDHIQQARSSYYSSVLRFKDWKRRFERWRDRRERRLSRTTATYKEKLENYKNMKLHYDPNATTAGEQFIALKHYHDMLSADREALVATMSAGRLERELRQMLNEARRLAEESLNKLDASADDDATPHLKYLAHCQHAQILFTQLVWDKSQLEKDSQLENKELQLLLQLQGALATAKRRLVEDDQISGLKATQTIGTLVTELKEYRNASSYAKAKADELLSEIVVLQNMSIAK